MKRYIKASSFSSQEELFGFKKESLEDYIGKPFDLSDRSIQEAIAEWATYQILLFIDESKQRNLKNQGIEIYCDDLSWSEDRIQFQVLEYNTNTNEDRLIDTFVSNLNFYDGPSTSYDDVEYLINNAADDFLVENDLG